MEPGGDDPREIASMSGHAIWTPDARVAVRLAVARDRQRTAKTASPYAEVRGR